MQNKEDWQAIDDRGWKRSAQLMSELGFVE